MKYCLRIWRTGSGSRFGLTGLKLLNRWSHRQCVRIVTFACRRSPTEDTGRLRSTLTSRNMNGLTDGFPGRADLHYRIIERLGAGATGVVYKAQDAVLDRAVALKFLPTHADGGARERFLQEARAAASLAHPNICTIHDIGEAEGVPFIATAFIEGEGLKDMLARGALPVAEAIEIASQIATGLERAHRAGVAHGNIKPSNVIVAPHGTATIIDFGIGRGEGRGDSGEERELDRIAYLAPEQIRGAPADQLADLWGLGVILHEMLTSKLPFEGGSAAAILHAIESGPPEPAAGHDLPQIVWEIVERALAADSSDRYRSAGEMLADLLAAARDISGPGDE